MVATVMEEVGDIDESKRRDKLEIDIYNSKSD